MFNIPLSVILAWPKPNYDAPPTLAPVVWTVTPLFLVPATLCVFVRLYHRIFVRRWFGLDDFLIIVAWLSALGVSTCIAIGNVRYDWSRHVWDVPFPMWSSAIKILYFARIFWGLASACTRLSVLCLYYRLARSSAAPKNFFWFLHGITGLTIGLLIFYLLEGIIPCVPIQNYWAWPYNPEHCMNDSKASQASALLNTFSEFVVATLPLFGVFKLGVDRSQRWTVLSVLSLGYLVAIAGCFRCFYLWKALTGQMDISWWGAAQWVCSEVENDLALMCACAAPLQPYFRRLYRKFRGLPTVFPRVPSALRSRSSRNNKRALSEDSDNRYSRDWEALSAWQSAVRVAIDLEGISNEDGYGYSVTISGPERRKRHLLPRFWLRRRLPESEDRSLNAYRDAYKAGLEIGHKTEVSVRRSEIPSRLDSRMSKRDDRDRIDCITPDLKVREPAAVELEKKDSLDKGGMYWHDARSVESLEALPAMPRATQSPTRQLGLSGLFKPMPTRRPSSDI